MRLGEDQGEQLSFVPSNVGLCSQPVLGRADQGVLQFTSNSSWTFNKTRSTNSACPLKARFLHSPLSCTTIGKQSELSQGETLLTCHSGSCDSQSVPPTDSGASVLWRWVSLHCAAYVKRRLLHVGILFISIFKKIKWTLKQGNWML